MVDPQSKNEALEPSGVTLSRSALDGGVSHKDTLEHAWRYFALHAAQRMSMFHYFLVVFGLTAAGLAGCLRVEGALRLAGVLLGVALVVISTVFQKLDERSSFLVKHAEKALRSAESAIPLHTARLFLHEPGETSDAELLSSVWTYGKSFRIIFKFARLVGIGGAILCFLFWNGWIH